MQYKNAIVLLVLIVVSVTIYLSDGLTIAIVYPQGVSK